VSGTDKFMSMEQCWSDSDRGKLKYSVKPHCSAILSTTNPTRTDMGSNLGLCNDRPETNCLSHGKTYYLYPSKCVYL